LALVLVLGVLGVPGLLEVVGAAALLLVLLLDPPQPATITAMMASIGVSRRLRSRVIASPLGSENITPPFPGSGPA
jgi:hypothetical protein